MTTTTEQVLDGLSQASRAGDREAIKALFARPPGRAMTPVRLPPAAHARA